MTNKLLGLGGASLLALMSTMAAHATDALPDPPKFAAQGTPKFVSIKDIFTYKALPAYSEPDWVTEQFVKTGKLPAVKDRLPKEPLVYLTSNMPTGTGVYGDVIDRKSTRLNSSHG